MEGKAVLFKKFAGIDVFDIEINEKDPEKLVEIIAALEPTFGGINLEDIKAPDCFYVERKLRERMNIPVFHDDQHGTAIVVGAAILNGLKVAGKDIGGGQAGHLRRRRGGAGLPGPAGQAGRAAREHLGHRPGRRGLRRPHRADGRGQGQYAQPTDAAHAGRGDRGADVFLGLSAGGVLKQDMVASMAPRPLIFALANPNPEIAPEDVKAVRDDAIMATGRTDYPNQVNNVLCFPYIFRGALDSGATTITMRWKSPPCTPSPSWRRPSRAKWWPRPTWASR
jgi:malate dehydrogenase (oxaloacetate-decarboxylating)(NADP+)